MPINSVKVNDDIISKNDFDILIIELEKEKTERIRLESIINNLNIDKIKNHENILE